MGYVFHHREYVIQSVAVRNRKPEIGVPELGRVVDEAYAEPVFSHKHEIVERAALVNPVVVSPFGVVGSLDCAQSNPSSVGDCSHIAGQKLRHLPVLGIAKGNLAFLQHHLGVVTAPDIEGGAEHLDLRVRGKHHERGGFIPCNVEIGLSHEAHCPAAGIEVVVVGKGGSLPEEGAAAIRKGMERHRLVGVFKDYVRFFAKLRNPCPEGNEKQQTRGKTPADGGRPSVAAAHPLVLDFRMDSGYGLVQSFLSGDFPGDFMRPQFLH